LSVVIPTFNRAKLVCDAIESALEQRRGEIEVIVVDDGSTDDTVDVIRSRFGDSIHLLAMSQRRGPGAARNTGVRVATGELLAFLDSDDLWLPGKLDAELRMFERFPGVEAIITDSLAFIEGRADDCTRFVRNGLIAAAGGEVRLLDELRWPWVDSRNGVATCSITVRRDALATLGDVLFAEDISCCEDWEFEIRVYHHCRTLVVPEVWSHVRRFDDGTRLGRSIPGTQATREQELEMLRARLKVMERSHWSRDLDAWMAQQFDRYRADTVRELAVIAGGEP
jgi:glycosyltransferase involved in cell wall biosynthesis